MKWSIDTLKWLLGLAIGISFGGGLGNYLATAQVDGLRDSLDKRLEKVDQRIDDTSRRTSVNEQTIAVMGESVKNIELMCSEMKNDLKEIKKDVRK